MENLRLFAGLHGGHTESAGVSADAVSACTKMATNALPSSRKACAADSRLRERCLHRPELLFLDEPTAGLDPVTARLVRQVIRDVREAGATIFLTTHDMVTADELCDRVAFLVDGTIAALDSPRALRLAHGRRVVRLEMTQSGRASAREFPLDGLADNPEFLAALRSGDVETMHTQETTLEDVFVQVTGRTLV